MKNEGERWPLFHFVSLLMIVLKRTVVFLSICVIVKSVLALDYCLLSLMVLNYGCVQICSSIPNYEKETHAHTHITTCIRAQKRINKYIDTCVKKGMKENRVSANSAEPVPTNDWQSAAIQRQPMSLCCVAAKLREPTNRGVVVAGPVAGCSFQSFYFFTYFFSIGCRRLLVLQSQL